ncbi:hypothetical protein SAMN02927937_00790 [Paenimyroides aquimaris]|uniref:Uncharacterized protein n=1 Tax=Paenimyroides marinum TaxID=1159016 RepID=A0A1H6JWQ9_9FLAO|nr:hypothetical protein [Paenimyroides aquimaris]SEH67040.1 hypothetical protein SAMN02927937_00790 [Paenimyroides aquimaris]
MKITILAFDLWGFNKKIADSLIQKDIEVTFLDLNAIKYIYKSKWHRAGNFLNKVFLGKNIKKDYRNRTLIKMINELPKQDYVLMVNPGLFRKDILALFRAKTNQLIAYNYDSLARIPLPENHNTLFNKIFSFDINDVKKHSYLSLLTNYIYLDKHINTIPKNKAFMILSKSHEREIILSKIADILDANNLNYEFIVANPATKKVNKKIHLTEQHIKLDTVIEKMKEAEILIDLVRQNQTGLSFRIFEAMALHKKIITNNTTIKDYDFYNENNILVIDNENITIPETFLNSEYQPLSEELYQKYTLDNWIRTAFSF